MDSAAERSPHECVAPSQPTAKTFITDPGPNDVLMGRGAPSADNTGNFRLRELVKKHRERYTSCAKRTDKARICSEIVSIIHSRGGKFLERVETITERNTDGAPKKVSLFQEITDNVTLRVKVKQLMRDVGPTAIAKRKRLREKHRQSMLEAVQKTQLRSAKIKDAKEDIHEPATEVSKSENLVAGSDPSETAKNPPAEQASEHPERTAEDTESTVVHNHRNVEGLYTHTVGNCPVQRILYTIHMPPTLPEYHVPLTYQHLPVCYILGSSSMGHQYSSLVHSGMEHPVMQPSISLQNQALSQDYRYDSLLQARPIPNTAALLPSVPATSIYIPSIQIFGMSQRGDGERTESATDDTKSRQHY